jgi:hypothetical protein
MHRTFRMIATAAVVVATAALPARSHAQQTSSADMQLLASYRLNASTLHKAMQASRNMAALAKDTAVLRVMAEHGDAEDANAKTIADIARQFDGVPPLKRAINSAGLTSKEYALFTMSLFQASMAAAMMDADGPYKLKELPKGTPKENVDFVRTHKAEIEKWSAEMKALSSGDEDEEGGDAPAAAGSDSTGRAR